MLKFLYAGNYTIHPHKYEFGSQGSDEASLATPEPVDVPREQTMGTSRVEGSPILRHEAGETTLDEEMTAEESIPSLTSCHPSYFHVRMYGEADYFMIDDLKARAMAYFRASFMDKPENESFSDVIKELYSMRANYRALKEVAIEMIVNNISTLRNGASPVLDQSLMKSVPDFTFDLCLATLDAVKLSGVGSDDPPPMKVEYRSLVSGGFDFSPKWTYSN